MSDLNFCMGTVSGIAFPFNGPEIHQITLEDLVAGLGNTCRFGGQIEGFYSVAEHSIHCANLLMAIQRVRRGETDAPTDADVKCAFMHDAAEAYVGDTVRSIKKHVPKLSEFEDAIMVQIAKRFCFPWPKTPWTHWADETLLIIERDELQPRWNREFWANWTVPKAPGLLPKMLPDIELFRWDPAESKVMYLHKYHQLFTDA